MPISRCVTPFYFLSRASVFRVWGEDHLRYLQGRITQDVSGLNVGRGAKSLLLSPTGKIQGQFVVIRQEQEVMLVSDPLTAEQEQAFAADLLRFKVADRVNVACLADELLRFVICGSDIKRLFTMFSRREPEEGQAFAAAEAAQEHSGLLLSWERWKDVQTLNIICPQSWKEKMAFRLREEGVREGVAAQLELFRIRSGAPRFGADLNDTIAVGEISLTGLASAQKGCYVGQEVVEMTAARGRPNKRLCLLELDTEHIVLPGSRLVEITASGSEREAGFVTSSIGDEASSMTLCLGFVKTGSSGPHSILGRPVRVIELGN